ncbi:MAG: hypothetical protein ACI8ZB_003775 [Desulforhopalus sp.]|jgi:hypothetical protein
MDDTTKITDKSDTEIEKIKSELSTLEPTKKKRALEKFGLAALGSIPWVGSFISAAASIKAEESTIKTDNLQTKWLEEHHDKMGRLSATLEEIAERFEKLGEQIDERIQSEEYLDLVRKSFRAWDKADTDQKRSYIANLITNASGTNLTSDDVIRLFIDWLELYHEVHFLVMREIYKNPGSSRYEIWTSIYPEIPREDSAEADLYKLLIRDLSTGGVIRQARQTTHDGRFMKKTPVRGKKSTTKTLESAFENTKPYVLTELGKQFVHYTMNDVVERIE